MKNEVTLEEVRHAQRTAPGDQATKELQRQYERQLSAIKAEARAAERRKEDKACRAEAARLRAELLAPRRLIKGVYLCVVSVKWAQWAGNAPAVAGGWVAVGLPGIRYNGYECSNRVAALPESWSDEPHQDIGINEVQAVWAEECLDNDELKQAIALLNEISKLEGKATL